MSKDKHMQAAKASSNGSYCEKCRRTFGSASALRMHTENSTAHVPAKSKKSKSKSKRTWTTVVLKKTTTETETTTTSTAPDAVTKSVVSSKSTAVEETIRATEALTLSEPETTSTPGASEETRDGSVEGKLELLEPAVYGDWSYIPLAKRDSIFEALSAQCHSVRTLNAEGIFTGCPNQADIEATRKCADCGMSQRKVAKFGSLACRFHPDKEALKQNIVRGRGTGAKANCVKCGDRGSKNGCVSSPQHTFGPADAKVADIKPCPYSSETPNPKARKAIALDCEMVGVEGSKKHEVSDVVRLNAVDFLTGEILVDIFVQPEEKVIAWRTKYSGVSYRILQKMVKDGGTVKGWQAARQLLWDHMDQQTILLGHNTKCDLEVLGIAHARIVDSVLLSRHAIRPTCRKSFGLKALALDFLGKTIQAGDSGHDCLEDSFATREVVLWCLRNPEELNDWANMQGGGYDPEERKKAAEKYGNPWPAWEVNQRDPSSSSDLSEWL
ncbi:ribonuclease H-like domain-containing protein [Aspergillus multicolor]|uniref:ribonuclease H-like domain-containing protein n=1 Tax=Aspergillus multicolor TaxID=41759 RepID=UPI003CCCA5BD